MNFRDVYVPLIPNEYNPSKFIENFRRELNKFRLRNVVVPNYVFLMMAFDQEMDEVHQAIIQAPRLSSNPYIHIQRIDSVPGDYDIYEEIISCINKSDFLIADLTLGRPNVYFELGYARGIGREVLTLAREGTNLHFDIRGRKASFYKGPIGAQKAVIEHIESREQRRRQG